MCGLAHPKSFVLNVREVIRVPTTLWCQRCFPNEGFNIEGIRMHGPSWIDREGACDQEPDSCYIRDFAQVRRMYIDTDDNPTGSQGREAAERFIERESMLRGHIIEQRFGSDPIPRQWRDPFISLPADDREYPEFAGRIFEGLRVHPNRLLMDRRSQQQRNRDSFGGRLQRFREQWTRVVANVRRFGNRYRPLS